MNPEEFLARVRRKPFYEGQLAHIERIPGRRPQAGVLDAPLPALVQSALRRIGADPLYTHQAAAINSLGRGQHVIVATGTASGKTLCYNVPVLAAAAGDWHARAIYLFPTKALAQDQQRALTVLTGQDLPQLTLGTYDGDTPAGVRSRLRKQGHIILTNPDMLHIGILPNHPLWANFFRFLRFVVVDEAHTYRGVFGSQVACVLRRLRRVCELYGSHPRFSAASATVANPGEHLAALTGLDIEEIDVVDQDGGPQGAKTFALWNPPFIDKAKSARRSPNSEATNLFLELIIDGNRTIVFTRARKVAELILRYARQGLNEVAPSLKGRIAAYRAGYRAEDRRAIERSLFGGELLGVTATNALELGVDIGSLDAALLVGYPGTIASMWQQAGRAGRRAGESLACLIAQDNPLDQWYLRHPKELFGRPHEHALIDPDNLYILQRHLPCAAAEVPLGSEDGALFGPGFDEALHLLVSEQRLAQRNERWVYLGQDSPAAAVNLRAVESGRFVILNEAAGHQVLEEIEASSAPERVHPGAIYLHQGESYLVTRYDEEGHMAVVRPVDVEYYTQARVDSQVRIVQPKRRRSHPLGTAYFGMIRVTNQVSGYRMLQQFSENNLGDVLLDMDQQTFVTAGVWWDVPMALGRRVADEGGDFLGGLHAVEHAAIGILPRFAMCDRWDIGGVSTPYHPDTGSPQIFIYDGFPGGIGIAEKGFELLPELWYATLDVIENCPCEDGCPSCVQSPKCGNNNEPLDKQAAITILEALLQLDG